VENADRESKMGPVPALNEFRNIHFIDAGDARPAPEKQGRKALFWRFCTDIFFPA
jgi:hypothetical protein